MKLEDPELEALVAAYRREQRPPGAARQQMWRRLAREVEPVPRWGRYALVGVVAIAALLLLWLGLRGELGTWVNPERHPMQAPHERLDERPANAVAGSGHRGPSRPTSEDPTTPSDPTPAPTPGQPSAPETASPTGVVDRSLDDPAAVDKPRRSPEATPRTDPPSGAPEPDDPFELIERAEAALRSGHPDRALRLLAQHEQRFPSAATREERRALRVLALCDLGRHAEGRGARHRFLRDYPRSAYRTRIEGACPRP